MIKNCRDLDFIQSSSFRDEMREDYRRKGKGLEIIRTSTYTVNCEGDRETEKEDVLAYIKHLD